MLVLALALPACATNSRIGAAATVHPLATQAALNAMARGGNAVDGAVAAALTLAVVDSHNSGLGGGCLILIRTASGQFIAIDGRETAPAAAARDMYVHNGKVDTEESKTGPRASGVPGELAALALAQKDYGKLTLADVANPAAQIADRGVPVSHVMADRLAGVAEVLHQNEAAAAVFFHPDGSPLREGDTLKQLDLANTLRTIARDGPDGFYLGDFARRCDTWMKEHNGTLTFADLANYRPKLRTPVISTYRGLTIVGFPPPSSGGMHVAQILNILENFDLASMDPGTRAHVMVEAMKRAFADRAYWLGDSDFVKVPRGLIDKTYARQLADSINLDHATAVLTHGDPPPAGDDLFRGGHTTHLSVADDQGNWVAITCTINTSFGSKVMIPGTGVVMNNEMDDFSIQPGVPNAFGLVGAEANAIAPGKRPLSSMSPTIVLQKGQPILACGAAGGPTIITQVVQMIVNRYDLNMSLHDAIAAPRLHEQWRPDEVVVEKAMPAEVIDALRQRGHTVRTRDHLGISQAVGLGHDAVHDPRAD